MVTGDPHDVSATSENGDTVANGVQGVTKEVVNTDITVNGNGSNNQCAGGVMSPDGSCS